MNDAKRSNKGYGLLLAKAENICTAILAFEGVHVFQL